MNNYLKLLEKYNNCSLINTSYPISPSKWIKYKNPDIDIFNGIDNFSIYIHIPFCNHICSFCEYNKCKKQYDRNEDIVINKIISDIHNFKKPNMLYGFDIGGGTPTSLSDNNFKKIINIANEIIDNSNKPNNFVASIEATFDTLTDEKINVLKNSNFKRISFGIQAFKKDFLDSNGRLSKAETIFKTIEKIRENFTINVDIMYGLNNIDINDLLDTIYFVNDLGIDQITLYETRYNLIKSSPSKSKSNIIKEYDTCFELLKKMGYNCRYGRNTFSKNEKDEGVSSYLLYRMNGFFYKGFGPSAQSMTNKGITYNRFKDVNKKEIEIVDLLNVQSYEDGDKYDLPSNELAAKAISISLYQSKINCDNIKSFYGYDILNNKKDFVDFLIKNNFAILENNNIILTKLGYKYYAAIGLMLYN